MEWLEVSPCVSGCSRGPLAGSQPGHLAFNKLLSAKKHLCGPLNLEGLVYQPLSVAGMKEGRRPVHWALLHDIQVAIKLVNRFRKAHVNSTEAARTQIQIEDDRRLLIGCAGLPAKGPSLGMLRNAGRRVRAAFRVRLGLAVSPGPSRIARSMRLSGSIVDGGIGTGC